MTEPLIRQAAPVVRDLDFEASGGNAPVVELISAPKVRIAPSFAYPRPE